MKILVCGKSNRSLGWRKILDQSIPSSGFLETTEGIFWAPGSKGENVSLRFPVNVGALNGKYDFEFILSDDEISHLFLHRFRQRSFGESISALNSKGTQLHFLTLFSQASNSNKN